MQTFETRPNDITPMRICSTSGSATERLFTDGWLKSKRCREEVAVIAASLQTAILDGIID
jgi:hypothetical protein